MAGRLSTFKLELGDRAEDSKAIDDVGVERLLQPRRILTPSPAPKREIETRFWPNALRFDISDRQFCCRHRLQGAIYGRLILEGRLRRNVDLFFSSLPRFPMGKWSPPVSFDGSRLRF